MKLHWASARKQAPSGMIIGEAEATARADVAAYIVEIQRGHSRVAGVVPVSKPDRHALNR